MKQRMDSMIHQLENTPPEDDVDVTTLAATLKVSRKTVRRYLARVNWGFIPDRATPNTNDEDWRWKRILLAVNPDVRALRAEDFIFSDEKIFRATCSIGKHWRCKDKYSSNFNHYGRKRVAKERWSCGIHVFGMIGHGWSRLWQLPQKGSGKGGGVNSEDFCRCLGRNKGEIQKRLQGKVLVLDGATIHTSAVTRAFWEEMGVTILSDWPAHSPDLNPIENYWALLVRKLGNVLMNHWKISDANRAVIWAEVKKASAAMNPQIRKNLVESFPRRLEKVLELNGDLVQ
jgi:transposase